MVGNKHCSYGLCNSDARYSHKEHMKDVYFLPFPKPQRNFLRCQKWVRACGRAEFTIANIKRNSYICSKHFIGGHGPTEDHPDPSLFVATDADIRESETRGRIGRSHRKRISVAISSSESENSSQAQNDDNQACASTASQYYTLVTLPNNVMSTAQIPTPTPDGSTVPRASAPKLLLISQPQSRKVSNNTQPSLLHPDSDTVTHLEPETNPENHTTQPLATAGGQIVAVKNFVIHGQKYTAVHIHPDGKEMPLPKKIPTNVRPRRKNQHETKNGVFVIQNNISVVVPPPWCVQRDTNVLTFRRISPSDSVLLSLSFNEDTSEVILKVLGMQITSHPILECLPNPVKLSNIAFVLKQFERWKVCMGNPDEKFQAVFHQRPKSSAFYSWIDDSVHSKTCELLSLKERCAPCKNYRGYLRCVLNREQKKLCKVSSDAAKENACDDNSGDNDEDEEQMSD